MATSSRFHSEVLPSELADTIPNSSLTRSWYEAKITLRTLSAISSQRVVSQFCSPADSKAFATCSANSAGERRITWGVSEANSTIASPMLCISTLLFRPLTLTTFFCQLFFSLRLLRFLRALERSFNRVICCCWASFWIFLWAIRSTVITSESQFTSPVDSDCRSPMNCLTSEVKISQSILSNICWTISP